MFSSPRRPSTLSSFSITNTKTGETITSPDSVDVDRDDPVAEIEARDHATIATAINPHDLTSWVAVAAKLRALLEVARQKIQDAQVNHNNIFAINGTASDRTTSSFLLHETNDGDASTTTTTDLKLGSFNTVEAGLLAYIKLTGQIQRRGYGTYRDDIGYEQVAPSLSNPATYLLTSHHSPSSSSIPSSYPNLVDTFELADWAYDDWSTYMSNVNETKSSTTEQKISTKSSAPSSPSSLTSSNTKSAKTATAMNLAKALRSVGYTLLRHDPHPKPGHAANYLAIHRELKIAVIGVKGTSSYADILTDCCANSVPYQLDAPIVLSSSSLKTQEKVTIHCHEGILCAAVQLADDLEVWVEELLLPNKYRILITGHSLGAGVATLLGMLLRSRSVHNLRNDNGDERLRVVAYASPPVVDYTTAVACRHFITTIVNNSDVIPRASLDNLVVLASLVHSITSRLESEKLAPRDFTSRVLFYKHLLRSKRMIMTVDELKDALIQAWKRVDIEGNPAHPVVPGTVYHMYDLWSKQAITTSSTTSSPNAGSRKIIIKTSKVAPLLDDDVDCNNDDDGDNDDGNQKNMQMNCEKSRIVERMHITDGSSKALRTIEVVDRMLSDHLSASYRKALHTLATVANATTTKTTTPVSTTLTATKDTIYNIVPDSYYSHIIAVVSGKVPPDAVVRCAPTSDPIISTTSLSTDGTSPLKNRFAAPTPVDVVTPHASSFWCCSITSYHQ
jgi:hypothetical protein